MLHAVLVIALLLLRGITAVICRRIALGIDRSFVSQAGLQPLISTVADMLLLSAKHTPTTAYQVLATVRPFDVAYITFAGACQHCLCHL